MLDNQTLSKHAKMFDTYYSDFGEICIREKSYSFNIAHRKVKDEIFSHIEMDGKKKPVKILDAGCGMGLSLKELHELTNKSCVELYGVDISNVQIERAKNIYEVPAKLFVSPIEELPFENSFFDFVICSEVLEHVLDPQLSLSELSRVIKKENLLILSTPNKKSIYVLIETLIKKLRGEKHVIKGKGKYSIKDNPIPKKYLFQYIKDANFEIIYVAFKNAFFPHAQSFLPVFVQKFLISLSFRVEKSPLKEYFCRQTIVIAKKV